MDKTIVVTRFIVTSKNCNTKLLSDAISKNFKMIVNMAEIFHDKNSQLLPKVFQKFFFVFQLPLS